MTADARQANTRQAGSLAGGTASLRHVLGEGFISNGPLASTATAVVAAAAFGGGALPLTVLLGALIALTWINTPYQFAGHISSAGGIYSFIRRSIGSRWAFSGSVGYFFYYVLLVPGGALGIVGVCDYVASNFGVSLPSWLWLAVLLVTTIPPFLLAWFRLVPSLAYGVVTACIEFVVVVAVSVLMIAKAGSGNTGTVFTDAHLAVGGWKGVIIGMAVASTALGGPDAVVFLGEEVRSPRSTIRKALLITQFSVIGLYLLYSYAITVDWGTGKMASFVVSPAPGLVLLDAVLGKVTVLIVTLLIVNSMIGVNLAVNLTASRMLFDHARSGLLHKRLAWIHPRHLMPAAALIVVLVVEIGFGVGAWAIWGVTDGFIILYLAASAGGVFSFIITDVALLVFARRRRLGKYVATLVIPVAGLCLLGVSVYGNFFPISFPISWGAVITLAAVVIGGLWAIVRRRRTTTDDEEAAALAEVQAA